MGWSVSGAPKNPKLLRRLLRAKDRMDAASHEEWPVRAAGARERRFRGAFRALVQGGVRRSAAPLPADAADRAGHGAASRHGRCRSSTSRFQTGWNSLGTFGRIFRDITGESPSELRAREKAAAARARPGARLLSPRRAPARSHNRSFGEAAARRRPVKSRPERRRSHEPRCRSGRSLRPRSGRSAEVLRREARVPRPHRRAATATTAG